MGTKTIIFIVLFVQTVICDPDYYWRPYFGTIPADAVPGTPDKSIFIGHAPLGDHGALVGEIVPNNPNISVINPQNAQVAIVSDNIQILCSGSLGNLAWTLATYQTLESITSKVVGGYERTSNGVLYVGRGVYNGALRLGKVSGYDPNLWGRILYVADGEDDVRIDAYDVLVYKE